MSNVDRILEDARDEYTNKIIEKIRDYYQGEDNFKAYVKILNMASDLINIYIHNQNKIYKTFKDEVYCIVDFVEEREYVNTSYKPFIMHKGILPKLILKTKKDESVAIAIDRIPEFTELASELLHEKDFVDAIGDFHIYIDFGSIFESYDNIFEDALYESELDDLGNIVDEKSFSQTLQYYLNDSINRQNATIANLYCDSNMELCFDNYNHLLETNIVELVEEKNLKNNLFKISIITSVYTERLKRSAIEYLEQGTDDILLSLKSHLTSFKLRDFSSYQRAERLFKEKRKDFEEICDIKNFPLPYNPYSFEKARANGHVLYNIFKSLKKDKVIDTLSILILAD